MDYSKYINEIVINKKNEKGVILDVYYDQSSNSNYIKVEYCETHTKINYKFNSFELGFLRFEKQELQKLVEDEIEQERIKAEKKKKEDAEKAELAKQAELAKRAEEKEKQRIKDRQSDQENRKNGIYKANFCDGNFSGNYKKYENWYKDKCSTNCMKRNVEGQSGPNCKNSICSKYIKGLKTIEDVKKELNKDMCYESHIFTSYDISAGIDGKKNPLGWNLEEDRVVILTTFEPEKEEKDRIIFGAFLIDKVYSKTAVRAARATSYPEYRIELSYEEANELKYWEYSAANSDGKIHWKENLLRYQTDDVCARILIDIVDVMKKHNRSTEDIENAERFLDKFLRLIGREKEDIPPKNGALIK